MIANGILMAYLCFRKQRNAKNAEASDFCESPPLDQRLLPPVQFDEKVPDVVTTNGKMPVEKRNYPFYEYSYIT